SAQVLARGMLAERAEGGLRMRFCFVVATLSLVACSSQQQVKPTALAPAPLPPPAPAPPPVAAPAPVVIASPALDPIHFDFDKSIIHAEDQAILVGIGDYMVKVLAVKLVVTGNTDERGTVEYNIALGDRRASAARDYLVRLGVDAARIKTISY